MSYAILTKLAKNCPERYPVDVQKRRLARAVADLTPLQREYLLRYLAGETVPKIAAATGRHKSTISRGIQRALKNLDWRLNV